MELCTKAMASSAMAARRPLLLVFLAVGVAGMPQGRPGRVHEPHSPLAAESLDSVSSLHGARKGANESFVELHVSSRGDMIRREADIESSHSQGSGAHKEPADIQQDGVVTVVSPAQTDSEEIKLEELTEECMQDEPTAECMEKFGSYGIRKLYTETWDAVSKLEYRRPGWMSHPEVQKRRLFELTLPGTVSSGTYAITGEDATAAGGDPYGVVSQNFNFYQQLDLGVRMFDIRVAYSGESSLVYISHGALMVPLATALRDMRRFLEEHEREVVVLDIRKDENADSSHLKPLIEEETTNTRIPGQLVHEAVQCELKEMLATYAVLSQLPGNEMAENPTIGALTDVGARVVYFWDTQQVLCTSFQECTRTPGWYPPDRRGGYPFAFGPPFVLGTRINATGGRQTARIIEPGCNTHSGAFTKDDQPERLLKKIKLYSSDLTAKTLESRPKCFPIGAALPGVHSPTLWYTVDGFVTATPEEQTLQTDRMRGVKAIYTRGEGYTVKTDAERTNYLLLSWFLKRNNQEVFTKPNAVMFEFAGSAPMCILRIIEAMQARPECGWAIYCKASGSCWADTLLGPEDECIPEDKVVKKLREHADGKIDDTAWVVYVTIALCSLLFVCCLVCTLGYIMKLMKGPAKPKEAEEPLAPQAASDAGDAPSDLPGSEAASDYGERPQEEPGNQTSAGAGAGVLAP